MTDYQQALQLLIKQGVQHLILYRHNEIKAMFTPVQSVLYKALMTEMIKNDMSFANGKAKKFYEG